MPRMAPGQVEADDCAVRKSEAGLAVEALDELQLARAIGRELQADFGIAGDPLEIRGILQEGQCRNPVEIEVRVDVGAVCGAVDRQDALAVSLIKLNVVERRLHGSVLDGNGDGRLSDREILESQFADVEPRVAVGDAEQRQVQLLARPAGALHGTVDF